MPGGSETYLGGAWVDWRRIAGGLEEDNLLFGWILGGLEDDRGSRKGGLEVLEIFENREKQCFTLIAFFRPYTYDLSSLMPRRRCILKRSVDWYQKFSISCCVVLYWAVFVHFSN